MKFKENEIVVVRIGNISDWIVAKYVYENEVGTHYVKAFDDSNPKITSDRKFEVKEILPFDISLFQ